MLMILPTTLETAENGMYHHGASFAFLTGISYSWIGWMYRFFNSYRGKRIKKRFTKEDMDEVMNEVVIMEEKN